MGLTLMADDRDLIIGELREGVRSIKEHLRRQDDIALARDQQMEINKREAIRAREEKEARDDAKHAENTVRLETMDRKLTTTYGLSSVNDQWINRDGKPAVQWVKEIGDPRLGTLWDEREAAREQKKAVRNRALGAAAVWGVIAAGVGGLATLAGMIGLDGIAALLVRFGRALGGN